ncbi:MAG: winged helix-turn-helix transcriptional regulator [Prevotellaceae bacterium]|nr:winged helix-turn-helix transcriptional regulator [Prevotellaceae bacterium]
MESQTVEYKESWRDEYLKTIEQLEIPEKAMREAIPNAIMHRDYANTSAIFMRIYDKSISLWNYGALPAQLTTENLLREHSSFPRNRLIAKTFFHAGYVETWGRGILNIVDYLKEANIAAPHFTTENNAFTMFLDRNENAAEIDKFMNVDGKDLQKDQKSRVKIIELIANNSSITQNELAETIGLSIKTIEKNIKLLKENGLLERVGADKGGYRKISQNQN